MKYLLILIAAVVVLMLHKHNRAQRMTPPGPRTRGGARAPEPMHACRHCGVHVPASRCVWVGDSPYCCAEHARLG